ncbi:MULTISPECIES: hypothetical protein [unclassified Thioalkalivibrio]|uniref:hypothetical protein n=1 Tax=unclassified Thioalkalivibrio TaxID=2621013 RepID=UPI000362F2AA|nr:MULTISPECIES: hypothetical protein [unclassified Thioalkalivibrio]
MSNEKPTAADISAYREEHGVGLMEAKRILCGEPTSLDEANALIGAMRSALEEYEACFMLEASGEAADWDSARSRGRRALNAGPGGVGPAQARTESTATMAGQSADQETQTQKRGPTP